MAACFTIQVERFADVGPPVAADGGPPMAADGHRYFGRNREQTKWPSSDTTVGCKFPLLL